MLERLRVVGSAAPPAMDDDSRISRAGELVRRLLIDVARLGRGLPADLDYVDGRYAELLREAVQPQLRAGATVDADFGEATPCTVTLPDGLDEPVGVRVVLDDASIRASGGRPGATGRITRWALALRLDPACRRILALQVERA